MASSPHPQLLTVAESQPDEQPPGTQVTHEAPAAKIVLPIDPTSSGATASNGDPPHDQVENPLRNEHLHPDQTESAKTAREYLVEMGVKNVVEFTFNWNHSRFQTINIFGTACQEANLPVQFQEAQVNAFVAYLGQMAYSISVLRSHWSTLTKLSKYFNIAIPLQSKVVFDEVKEEASELLDAKVPVSFEMLLILLAVAEDILIGTVVVVGTSLVIFRVVDSVGSNVVVFRSIKVNKCTSDHNGKNIHT